MTSTDFSSFMEEFDLESHRLHQNRLGPRVGSPFQRTFFSA